MFIVPVPNVCNTNRKANIFRGRTGPLVEHQTEIPGAILSWVQFPVPNVRNTNRKTNIFRGRTGQLVEHQTEIPGAVLSWIQFSVATKDFFSSDQLSVLTLFQCSHSPLCAAACISNHVHIKNPKHWQPCYCLDTEILRTLLGMSSAVLVAVVALLR